MSIFKNNKQTKLTTTLIQDLNWMVKRVSVDTLPEYQQNSDTLQFRDNIKLYEFEIEWIKTGFSHHLRELEIQGLQKRCLESVSYNSNNFKYPTPL